MTPSGESIPRVSVLMSVYNDGQYLRASIDSLLGQTCTDLELIIVDDASSDDTASIIAEMAATDARIVHLANARNLGLPGSLNRALDVARGPFVARHDGDDVSHPTRLAKQLAYLEQHPAVDVVGTQMVLIEADGRRYGTYSVPLHHSLIVWALLDRPLAHATTMMRTAVLRGVGGYDPECIDAEDVDLWTRMAPSVRFANLPEALYDYRRHDRSTSRARRCEQLQRAHQLRARFMSHLVDRDVPEQHLVWLQEAQSSAHTLSVKQIAAVVTDLLDLYDALAADGILLADELPLVRATLATQLAELGGGLAIEDEKTLIACCRKLLRRPVYLAAMAATYPRLAVVKALRPLRRRFGPQ